MHMQDNVEMGGSLNNVSSSAQACKLVSLLQLSFAAAKHVFSLLENSFCEKRAFLAELCLFSCYVAIQQVLIFCNFFYIHS